MMTHPWLRPLLKILKKRKKFERIYEALQNDCTVTIECETPEIEREFLREFREFVKDRPPVGGHFMTKVGGTTRFIHPDDCSSL